MECGSSAHASLFVRKPAGRARGHQEVTRALESCNDMRLCDALNEGCHKDVFCLNAGGWEKNDLAGRVSPSRTRRSEYLSLVAYGYKRGDPLSRNVHGMSKGARGGISLPWGRKKIRLWLRIVTSYKNVLCRQSLAAAEPSTTERALQVFARVSAKKCCEGSAPERPTRG